MAKANGMRRWTALRRTLAVPDNPHLKALARPTDETLDQYEAESEFRLPHSYRSFIKVFGPGVLAWDYRIVAPGYPEQGGAINLPKFNAELQPALANERVMRQFKDPAQVRRVVFFCRKGGGDLIGWDSGDIRDTRRHEYGIYVWGRGDALGFVAGSFTEFVEEVCLSDANLRITPEQEAELGTPRAFFPDYDLKSTATP